MPGSRALYEAALRRGKEFAWKGKWDRALQEYRRALQALPGDREALAGVALAYLRLKRWTEAQEGYRKLLELDPQNPLYMEHLAEALEGGERREEAAALYGTAAQAYANRREWDRALELAQRRLRLAPKDPKAWEQLAQIQLERGDREGAGHSFLQLARLRLVDGDREGAEGYWIRARELLGEGDPEVQEVARSLRLEARRGQTGLLLQQAGEAFREGRLEEAARFYEAYLAQVGEDAAVLYNLGGIYRELGRYAEALTAFRRAQGDPEYVVSALYMQGEIFYEQGRLEAAAQAFEQALASVPEEALEDPESLEELIFLYERAAEVYEKLDRTGDAGALYRRLADLLEERKLFPERVLELREKAANLERKNIVSRLVRFGTGLMGTPTRLDPRTLEALEEEEGEEGREEEESPSLPFRSQQLPSIQEVLQPSEPVPEPEEPLQPPAEPRRPSQETDLRLLQELVPQAPPAAVDLTPLPEEGLDPRLQQRLRLSEYWTAEGHLQAALDVCLEIVTLDPEYLPIHLRLGEIYEKLGWLEMAREKYRALIDTYLAREEVDGALQVFPHLLALSPQDVVSRRRYAELLRQVGREEAALEQQLLLVEALAQEGEWERANREIEALLRSRPRDLRAYLIYGRLLLQQEAWRPAAGAYRRALELAPDNLEALAGLTLALPFLGAEKAFWAATADLLRRVREAAPPPEVTELYQKVQVLQNRPELAYVLGRLLQAEGHLDRAMVEWEAGLEQAPERSLSRYLLLVALAEGHLAQGQFEPALGRLQEAEPLATLAKDLPEGLLPRDPALPLRLRAEALAELGQVKAAARILEAILEKNPYDREACTRLADIYFQMGDLPRALAQLQRILDRDRERRRLNRAIETAQLMVRLAPNQPDLRLQLAELLLERGMVNQALAGFRKAATLFEQQGEIRHSIRALERIADVYWMMGQRDEALQVYQELLHKVPGDVELRRNLIALYLQIGDRERAAREQRNLVRILRQQGKVEEVVEALHQWIALEPENPEGYYELGEVLTELGEYRQLIKLYRRLLKLEPDNPRVRELLAQAEELAGEAS